MRLRPLALLLVLAVLSLIAAGCGDDDDDDSADTADTTEVETSEDVGATGATGEDGEGGGTSISMTEFAFDPADATVSEGDSLEVTNDGAIPHNYTVDGEDVATEDL